MRLVWKIRYLDRADKQFKDRCLYLHTRDLDPFTRAAVELVIQNKSPQTERTILKYRHLFIEDNSVPRDLNDPNNWREERMGFCLSNYFEDETGHEIAWYEIGPILTGNPKAVVVPPGIKHHDLDLMFADQKPIPDAAVTLSPEEIRLLGYFSKDLREMLASAFMKDGPGSLRTSGEIAGCSLETAATDEEIRSFVTIFRRLYMTGHHDPASFLKIIPIFTKALGDHPYSKWVARCAKEYQNHLDSVPNFWPMRSVTFNFTTKRLIDVFLYTQYAHQPNEDRQRQYSDCLSQVQENRPALTWLFLTEMWNLALEIGNAGRVISSWFQHWCKVHGVSPDILNSLRDDHSGLGVIEKEEDRQKRLFQEKVEELALELWKENGRPEGSHSQFIVAAREQLGRLLNG